jgi:ribose transport system permease protein
MSRIAGVTILLVVLYALLYGSNPNAFSGSNLRDLANTQGYYGVLTLAAALVIITGGIDLSIGSVLGLSAVLFGVLMEEGVHPYAAALAVILVGMTIGCVQGVLITKLKLQAFLVTLCGMFIYRGIARQLSKHPVGLVNIGNLHPEFQSPLHVLQYFLVGKSDTGELVYAAELIVLLVLVAVAAVFLHKSVYGRYWYAIGYNDQAARYAGINADRHRIVVYALSGMLSALAGVLVLLDFGSVMPESVGTSDELYAITGAVLGGCSLRGGEGTAIGIVLGAAVLPLLKNLVIFLRIPDAVVPSIIGLTLLFGVIVDETVRRGGFRFRFRSQGNRTT